MKEKDVKALKRASGKLSGLYKYLVTETNKWVIGNTNLDLNINKGLELCEDIKNILERDLDV